MIRKTLCVVMALALWATAGCAFDPTDPLGHRDGLHWAQKRYSQALRWGEIERASKHVDPEQREEFLEVVRQLADVHFTDYEIGEVEMENANQDATVRVVYSGYLNTVGIEKQFEETQHWHRESGTTWLLHTEIAQLREAVKLWTRP